MIDEYKKISCLRCGRVLPVEESRCSICLKKEIADELQKNHNGLSDGQIGDKVVSDSDKESPILKWLVIAFFAFFLIGMIVGFFRELHENGLVSAAKNKGAILWIGGAFLIIHLLGSREWLDKHGFGIVHKFLRYVIYILIIFFGLMMIGLVFDILNLGGSSGLPDNIRM